jgi:ABC-type uncharacterized transport system substrate-binding protein
VRGIDYLATRSSYWLLVMLAMAMAIAGCTSYTPVAESTSEEPTVVVPAPEPIETPPQDPEPRASVPVPPRLPPIAIVLTNSQPAYLDVAVELANYFADHTVYDLSNESVAPVTVLRSINDTQVTAVVAIGLRAAQSAVAMAEAPVVFSQVFNHQDHELLAGRSRGVAAIAPLALQLAAWKKIHPTLTQVGMIIGEGHDGLIAEAELAALQHDIELQVRIAHSDQETLYLFRRMIRDIDGFWLFPDNRILSARVLNQMLADANRQRVPVAGPNEAMLRMGAAISMSTVVADIAAKVAGVVRQIQAGNIDQVPAMTELSEVRVAINDQAPTRQAVAKVKQSP